MGYDTKLERAYDFDKPGWKSEELACGDAGTEPVLACNPAAPSDPSPAQTLLGVVYTEAGASWNAPRPDGITMTQQDIENRKIFNTHLYSQGNQGHDFTAVLSDAERSALIESLKTL